jgi:hypothetical protein
VEQLCSSPVTLQMFVACHGLRVLVHMLDSSSSGPPVSGPPEPPPLISTLAVECIWRTLTTEGIMPLNSCCRCAGAAAGAAGAPAAAASARWRLLA